VAVKALAVAKALVFVDTEVEVEMDLVMRVKEVVVEKVLVVLDLAEVDRLE
jgi:hypothetical protein